MGWLEDWNQLKKDAKESIQTVVNYGEKKVNKTVRTAKAAANHIKNHPEEVVTRLAENRMFWCCWYCCNR